MYAGPSHETASGGGFRPPRDVDVKPLILDAVMLVERVHRRFLEAVKDELDRLACSTVNPVQAVLLFNIGDADLTAGALKARGFYLGSNVSYNIKQLVAGGHLVQERCRDDRRAVRIRLTESGRRVADIVARLYDKSAGTIVEAGGLPPEDLRQLSVYLQRLDRYWDDRIRFRL